jgi:hypothetical protein
MPAAKKKEKQKAKKVIGDCITVRGLKNETSRERWDGSPFKVLVRDANGVEKRIDAIFNDRDALVLSTNGEFQIS